MELQDAIKKIDDETKKYNLQNAQKDIADMVIDMATENEGIREGIEKHTLAEVLGEVIKKGFEIKAKVHDDILKAAGLKPDKNKPVYDGSPSRAQIKKIIREVYTK